jgi:hypothetical protein
MSFSHTVIKMHLISNVPNYLKRVLKGFFMWYKVTHNANINPGELSELFQVNITTVIFDKRILTRNIFILLL